MFTFFILPIAAISAAALFFFLGRWSRERELTNTCESVTISGFGSYYCQGLQHKACGAGWCAEHHREKCKGECIAPDSDS